MKKQSNREIGHILSLIAVAIVGITGMISLTGLLKYLSTFLAAYGIAMLLLVMLRRGPYER
jgi:TRAP-type uncharacterized transport system fused permease subunit